jgi:hypothetical protein
MRLAGYTLLFTAALASAQSKPPKTPAQNLSAVFHATNAQILEMAKDFPDDKYGFRLKPEMRSFADVMVHVASGNVFASKAGRGEKVKWDELDPKNYHGKAEVVALLEKSIAEANAALTANPTGPTKDLEPFLSVMEHSAEHYGLLVAYYRANGLVPPASRPNSK